MKKKNRASAKILATTFLAGFSMMNAQLTIIGSNVADVGAVNNSGTVSMHSGGQIFKWSVAGGPTSVGIMGPYTVGRSIISNNGSKIASTILNGSDTTSALNEIGIYDVATATWTFLGGVGSSSGPNKSSTWNMSAIGTYIVGGAWKSAGELDAVKWDAVSGLTPLQKLFPGNSSRANAVSEDGIVVAGWQDMPVAQGGGRKAVRWVNGVASLILDGSGNKIGEPIAMSADGSIIVGLYGLPYVWNSSTGVTYITHPNQFYQGGATAVSADGTKVLGYFRQQGWAPTDGEGFIWTAATGRVNLNTYVTGLGIPNPQNYIFSLPTAISPDGTKIAGMGRYTGSSTPSAFYLDLTSYLSTDEGVKSNNTTSIYPNPVKDILYIKGIGKIEKAEIYNMVGQKVRVFDSIDSQINVSSLPKGNFVLHYMVKGEFKDFKFIKQ